ncbi:ornithine cyclodeaminase family protein [Microbacterium luticocti]|uniref:ornithine cyclodeaminase family protein n=1 Tax=Microbacterium luticocti TaxID=451764 RepID=UPI00040B446A|nr:hypothetical protein [Microbacterium luticocti]
MADPISRLRMISADALTRLVPMADAIAAVRAVLVDGFDPALDLDRTIVDVPTGQLLLMPSAFDDVVGHKLATVAPDAPGRTVPRIQALYVLIDAAALSPIALIDGTALTTLRTPAVSAAVLDDLAAPDAASLVVFGTGPQGVAHVAALAAIRRLNRVRLVGRDAARAAAACAAVHRIVPEADVAIGSAADVPDADLVVCATTSTSPLFAAADVRERAAVVAVGSHSPDARELDGALLGRAQVVVETRRVAREEAGDVVLAVADGALDASDVVPMADVVTGRVAVAPDRPRVLKTCGMGWQDLVVARLAEKRMRREE